MAVGIVNLLEVVHIHHHHVIALGVARRLQIAFQLVTVVERGQRIRRNQKILQVQVNEQNDHGTPEAENRRRHREEHLQGCRHYAARGVATHNQVRLEILAVFRFKSAEKAPDRHRHDVNKREEHQHNIVQVTQFQFVV